MTLEEARADVLERLDDESGRRYAASGDYAKVDRALDVALARRLDDYVAAGGDRFNEDVDDTATSAGLLDLSAYDPLALRGVLVVPDGDTAYHPIKAIDPTIRGVPVSTAYTLRVVLVRRLTVPRDHPDQALTGGDFAGARSWDAFDDLVVATAALRLGIKDDELRKAMLADMASLESSVMGHRRAAPALAWPDVRRERWLTWRQLRWVYVPRDRQLTLFHASTP